MLRAQANAAHMEKAEGRGAGWIQRALALKQKAERDNCDYRTALGALAGLYYAHPELQEKLRAALSGALLLAEDERRRPNRPPVLNSGACRAAH